MYLHRRCDGKDPRALYQESGVCHASPHALDGVILRGARRGLDLLGARITAPDGLGYGCACFCICVASMLNVCIHTHAVAYAVHTFTY